MFASTKAGGDLLGFPNVCNVPAPPAPPVPTPFPSQATAANASGGTCSTKVKFAGAAVVLVNSEIPMSMGDEAGKAGGGVVSGTAGDKVAYKNGSTAVKVEGKFVALHLQSITAHNGANANMPAGSQLSPSQAKVMIGR